jgi:hypothetical protein
MRKENYSDLTLEEPPKRKVTKLPHRYKKETHKHHPHGHNLLTPCGYKQTIVTTQKYLSHRKWDVNGHARSRLQGEHDVKTPSSSVHSRSGPNFHPARPKSMGYHDNAPKR